MGGEFLIGQTLSNGAFRVTEVLLAGGSQFVCVAERRDRPGRRYLASAIAAPKGVPVAQLERDLGYQVPGVLELEHIGQFDVGVDADGAANTYEQQHWALVEALPDGEWLPRAVTAPPGLTAAVSLGVSVGQILERAATKGVLLVGLRPEYIWIHRQGDEMVAAGVTCRNRDYFRHTGAGCMLPGIKFERSYVAPEILRRGNPREESLVFTLGLLIAEWATGVYPFPTSWAGNEGLPYFEGRHPPIEVPGPLASLLASCFKPEPAQRPSLAYLMKRLGLLRPAQLAP